jgi:hypothetical protein
MKRAATIAQMLVRITGVVQIVLGLFFWTGNTPMALIQVHMLIGMVLVVALAVLAVISIRAGVSMGLVIAGFVFVVLTPFVGIGQLAWQLGSTQWLIQVVHLLIGLGAIGLSEQLGKGIKESPRPAFQR